MQLSSSFSQGVQRGFGGPRAQINRQAVFDRAFRVLGYEITCHSLESIEAEVDSRTSNLILDAFSELGLDRIVGDRLIFIPVEPDVITDDLLLPIPKDRAVLQLDVATAPFDHSFVEAVRGRIGEGFRPALDNYSYRDELVPLLELVHYLKIDIALLRDPSAAGVLQQARTFGVQLIVKNVETHEDVRFCTEAGCDGVQGGFLCQPKVVETRRAPRNIAVLAELLAQLKLPNASFADIEEIVKKDAGLSATLLRFLNSAGFGLRVQVSTIRQAVALLGLNEFGKWVTLMTMAAGNDKPTELLVMALIRAKTCELVMRSINKSNSGNLAFMAGLFSLLDALLDQPLERVLADLPIADALRLALLENAGLEGELLAAVLDYERGLLQDDSEISPATISSAWCYSVAWVEGMRATLS